MIKSLAVKARKTEERPLIILHGDIKTPPLSAAVRIEAGMLIRRLQRGQQLSMPVSCPMPSIGTRCAELQITDENVIWRIVYRVDSDAAVFCYNPKNGSWIFDSRVEV